MRLYNIHFSVWCDPIARRSLVSSCYHMSVLTLSFCGSWISSSPARLLALSAHSPTCHSNTPLRLPCFAPLGHPPLPSYRLPSSEPLAIIIIHYPCNKPFIYTLLSVFGFFDHNSLIDSGFLYVFNFNLAALSIFCYGISKCQSSYFLF